MEKFEYFGGIPEIGIVPRAPHAGPLVRHVYEQEHGRGGFAGKVTHTYHLYPPNNWLPDETRVLDRRTWAPDWESPLGPLGGVLHALDVLSPDAPRDVYRGMARLVANATVAMNVTAPRAPMDYVFEHHSATLVFFIHQGGGTLETMFGPIEFRKGDFLIVPKGIAHRFELQPGPQSYWVYESFAGDPEKSEAPTTGQFITHSRSDYKYPRTLDTRNESGRFEIVSKVADVYTRRVHPTHPFDVVGWRGDYLPYRFAVEDVRPLVADRSHVPPSGHTIFKLPGCYLCIFTVRSVEKEGMWLPFFHKNLDYLETLGYHFGDFFSGGGVVREGMVTLHPVGLPHGPKPASLKAFLDGKNPGVQRGGDHGRSREPDRDLGVRALALDARLHGGLVRLHDRSALRAPARQARGDPRAGRARRRRARRAPAEVSGARVTAVGVRSEEAERAAALAFDLRALPDDFYADPFPAR